MEEKTPLQKVFDVFINYYGEDNVDLQQNTIIIYFPKVTVTNENDRSVDITELYVKVTVNDEGKLVGTFTLNRAEYPVEQWYSNYLHSHVKTINKQNLSQFQNSCLGAGPIKDTCLTLSREFDEDIWTLFALELDKYVHTESIKGVPYKYMEQIGNPTNSVSTNELKINSNFYNKSIVDIIPQHIEKLNEFILFLLSKKPFSFNFIEKYSIADSDYNIVIKTSNIFIEWYNSLTLSKQGNLKEDMLNNKLLVICKVVNGKFISKTIINHNFDEYRRVIGTPLLTFKGNEIKLNITGIPDNNVVENYSENDITILHPDLVMHIINKMLRIINYRYGRESSNPGQESIYL